jgi:hypothetical protein
VRGEDGRDVVISVVEPCIVLVLERRGLGFGGMVTMVKGLEGGCVVVVIIIFVVNVEPSRFRTWRKEGRGTTTMARGEDTSSSSSSALTSTSMPSTPIPAVKRPQNNAKPLLPIPKASGNASAAMGESCIRVKMGVEH